MNVRLSEDNLARLPPAVATPRYCRGLTGAGIVHLGAGAFHRAHQAWYTDLALARAGGHWGIVAASLRSPDVRNRLMPQDGLYTLVERDGNHRRQRVIGAIKTVLVAPENPRTLVEWLSDPDIRVITLTITEKGYCHDASSGRLRLDHPDIRRDLERFPEMPVTAVGYLAAGLARRRQLNRDGVTLLSCDNLPHNGRVLKTVVTDFVAEADPSLLPWIEKHVTFPCSMVDRIVPATTEEDLAGLESVLGCRDEAAVFTEPFNQWVVENNFARGAPLWQNVGALLVADVAPFETMKLRLLNGSHSLIAYLGYLAGYEYVHQVMANGHFRRLVRAYMDDQAQPSLTVPDGFDIDGYKENLCRRFANASLNHRAFQIAQDGSQKIPQRWLAAVRVLEDGGQSTNLIALAVAGWIHYLGGRRDNGDTFEVDDPLVDELRAATAAGTNPAGIFTVEAVFGDLARSCPAFVRRVEVLYRRLVSWGVAKTVIEVVDSSSRRDSML